MLVPARRLADEMPIAHNTAVISFGFLNQFVLFPCERSNVPVSILWQDCRLRMAFKNFPCGNTLRDAHAPTQVHSGRNMGPPVVFLRVMTDAVTKCSIRCARDYNTGQNHEVDSRLQ